MQILRYERLSKCVDKISELIKVQKPDLILFHIRPEPLLRICKFYYRYKDAIGRLIRTLNFAALGKSFPERYNYQISPVVDRTYEYPKEGVFHRFLINSNYLFGVTVGNLDYGLKFYLELVKQVRRLCEKEKIKLLVIGPVSRPHTFLENWLAEKLHIYIRSWAHKEDAHFVNCIGKYSKDNKSLFGEEGIYVNKIGHRRIAKLIQAGLIENHLFESIENKIELHEEILL